MAVRRPSSTLEKKIFIGLVVEKKEITRELVLPSCKTKEYEFLSLQLGSTSSRGYNQYRKKNCKSGVRVPEADPEW